MSHSELAELIIQANLVEKQRSFFSANKFFPSLCVI